MLSDFTPDIVKLDMAIVRGLDSDARRHAIVQGIVGICRKLSIQVVAEGVETRDELSALRELGVERFQGFLFAKPGFEELPTVVV
jgi:EAL domain-containing protein (putative c-di-GMP-specific phosphodiesterase class I)